MNDEIYINVIDPSTGEVFGDCPAARRRDLHAAVSQARRAIDAGVRASTEEIRAFLRVLHDNIPSLVSMLSKETGKPSALAHKEILGALTQGEALLSLSLPVEHDARAEVRFEPLGIIGVISPWNAPVLLSLLPTIAALHMGNAVIVKTSPHAPLTMRLIGALSPLPAGLFTVLAGDDDLGRFLASHSDINGIRFTGSVQAGQAVLASSAINMKRVVLELGGNDAAIVLDDADVPEMAKAIYAAAMEHAGQRCVAIKRLYVHADRYDDMVHALIKEAHLTVVGSPTDPKTTMGPVQNKRAHERLQKLIITSLQSGGRVLYGGGSWGPGYFIAPTLIDQLPRDAELMREEQFGPILPITRFFDEDDAVRLANDSYYQLGGSVWGRDVERARRIARRLRSGMAWTNSHGWASAFAPFGGADHSGIGCSASQHGLRFLTQMRVLHTPV